MCHSGVPKLLSDMPKSTGGWAFTPDHTGELTALTKTPYLAQRERRCAASNAAKGAASNAAGWRGDGFNPF